MAECMGEIEDLDLGKIQSDQVLNQLECPVCYDYIIPPVKQCKERIFVIVRKYLPILNVFFVKSCHTIIICMYFYNSRYQRSFDLQFLLSKIEASNLPNM